MPVSKNKRGQRRRKTLAKAADTFGRGGAPDQFDRTPQAAPSETNPPDVDSQEQTSEETTGTG